MEPLYPFRFTPIYKDYVWGGDRIIRRYGRVEPPGCYAESWEIADHPDGMSVLENGPLAGLTLHELVGRFGAALLGRGDPFTAFPLILKLLDARERLSVQVHPDEEAARRYGGEPKTELWYTLDAEPGAGVFAGVKPGVDRTALERALAGNGVEAVLQFVPLQAGDVVYIPAGRLHAVDAGCLLLEVQQRSNTTYRLYDWNRRGADGRTRALHTKQALEAVCAEDDRPVRIPPQPAERFGPNERRRIMRTPYFAVEHWRLAGPRDWLVSAAGTTFEILFVVAGRLRVEGGGSAESLGAGDTVLLPAAFSGRGIPERPETELIAVMRP